MTEHLNVFETLNAEHGPASGRGPATPFELASRSQRARSVPPPKLWHSHASSAANLGSTVELSAEAQARLALVPPTPFNASKNAEMRAAHPLSRVDAFGAVNSAQDEDLLEERVPADCGYGAAFLAEMCRDRDPSR